jgi:hypothetical protein
MDFEKYAYEEVYRYFQFKRTDGKDGLATNEILVSHSVTCKEKETGADYTSTMITNTAISGETQVVYLLKGGVSGTLYNIEVKAVTTQGQKLEGFVEIAVK